MMPLSVSIHLSSTYVKYRNGPNAQNRHRDAEVIPSQTKILFEGVESSLSAVLVVSPRRSIRPDSDRKVKLYAILFRSRWLSARQYDHLDRSDGTNAIDELEQIQRPNSREQSHIKLPDDSPLARPPRFVSRLGVGDILAGVFDAIDVRAFLFSLFICSSKGRVAAVTD